MGSLLLMWRPTCSHHMPQGATVPHDADKVSMPLIKRKIESVGLPTETTHSSPAMSELQPQANEAKRLVQAVAQIQEEIPGRIRLDIISVELCAMSAILSFYCS